MMSHKLQYCTFIFLIFIENIRKFNTAGVSDITTYRNQLLDQMDPAHLSEQAEDYNINSLSPFESENEMDFSDLLVAFPSIPIEPHDVGGSYSEFTLSPLGTWLQDNAAALGDDDVSFPGIGFINRAELCCPADEPSLSTPADQRNPILSPPVDQVNPILPRPADQIILVLSPPDQPVGRILPQPTQRNNYILTPPAQPVGTLVSLKVKQCSMTLSRSGKGDDQILSQPLKKKRGRPPKLKEPAPPALPRVKKYDLIPDTKAVRNAIAARKTRIRAKERLAKLEAEVAAKEDTISRQNKTIELQRVEILKLKDLVGHIEQTLNLAKGNNQGQNFGMYDGN
ncbi:uncharacterized protein LOC110859105 isoform X1 [Folsomia candida]|uniref:uncharacterized protein LOC110859105 isoform X1 n=1 Tax=Folsomia candida TaxID=158441 RepID=UPI001604C7C5|nr:uncharacterized protein LOC110859105 isoform X1 [Folsomia candida]XP_035715184.1 uncharacterized protein LOC110859105 isoform X1 [Folsomia candida]XP_035715185.1 uncharacterized protein LOC110859105 isoform X1 [Folsomia candida]XP_035715186.1 uncharacterized protein LOC110859105 isoform X1 [Folsomia candida]